ncbi:MAG: N,N-diacetylchitobiose transport system substrate-binding protein [Cryptosporangiaceae bacterium]|nr:N,N-diacetylchitobiose transport system substrate-binding protein [Cryptosporangiaceae bacterium]
MNIARWAAIAVTAALTAGCAPSTADPTTSADAKTGTLTVWLYDEADRSPKEKVLADAVHEFTGQHKDVKVEISYIPTDPGPRAEKMKGAFNDPASAPDLAEFGNTDLAGYVAAGAMADLTGAIGSWDAAKDLPQDVKDAATVNGKMYGLPWWVGVRALYYRTDVFTELGITPPTSYAQLVDAARKVRKAKPKMLGIAVGGKYVFGALPFIWDAGGDLATESGGKYRAAIASDASKAGVKNYAALFAGDICPPEQCADLTGGKTVDAFAAGLAGMAILPNSSRGKVDAGATKGKYGVVPLPGAKPGSIAPAFAGGNDLGVLKSAKHRTLAIAFAELLASKKYQLAMYDAMGNLPTLSGARGAVVTKDKFLAPFVNTMSAGTRFVPNTPAWTTIDAQTVVPTMLQKVVAHKATVDAATAEAETAMNAAFGG